MDSDLRHGSSGFIHFGRSNKVGTLVTGHLPSIQNLPNRQSPIYKNNKLLCPVCYQYTRRRNITTLSCHHLICQNCHAEIKDSTDEYGEKKCPICKTELEFSDSEVEDEDVAIHLQRNLSTNEKNEEFSPLNLMVSNSSLSGVTSLADTCTAHKYIKYDYYCLTCKCPACDICRKKLHKQHQIMGLPEAANEVRKMICQIKWITEEKLTPSMRTTMEQAEANKIKLSRKRERLENAVKQRKDEIVSLLEDQTEKVLAKLKEEYEKVDLNMQGLIKQMKSQYEVTLQRCCNLSQDNSKISTLRLLDEVLEFFSHRKKEYFSSFLTLSDQLILDFNIMVPTSHFQSLPSQISDHIGNLATGKPSALSFFKPKERPIEREILFGKSQNIPQHLAQIQSCITEWERSHLYAPQRL